MRWSPFKFRGAEYDLSHLHVKTETYFQPAKGTNLPHTYKVDVIYSLHCFTRGEDNTIPDPALRYSDSRETRVFDFERYELSRELPGIIRSLMTRKCFHGNRENYLTVEIVDRSGNTVDYEIYFTVSRSSRAGVVNLYVQSAYTRDVRHAANRPKMKEIAFPVILFTALKR